MNFTTPEVAAALMSISAGPEILPVKSAVAPAAGAMVTVPEEEVPIVTGHVNEAVPALTAIVPPSAIANGPPLIVAVAVTITLSYDSPPAATV